MTTEEEKRLCRCCFTGHRPEKLQTPETEIKNWLYRQIENALEDGFVTFITGMAMGVDIWAGQIVVRLRESNPAIHLIAVVPWNGFAVRWHENWKDQYSALLAKADLVKVISDRYRDNVFRQRNEWMVNHCARVIAFFNGSEGGTREMIDYARKKGIETIVREDLEKE